MRSKALAFALASSALAVAGASAAPPKPPPPPAAKIAACNSGQIGFLGPLTGPYARVGRNQLAWAKRALADFDKANGTSFTLRQADTRLVPKLALRLGSAFAADKSLLATIGPAGSQEVTSVGKVFGRRGLPAVLSSATSVTLTGGAYPTFSRVVASDAVQGESDALFMIEKLHARKVLIVDDEEPYSTLIASSATKVLKASGVQVERRSVVQSTSDFSSLIAGIPRDTDVVLLPWELASNAQFFAQQLQDQGVTTNLLGSDALDSAQFTMPGAYVSSFARQIRGSLFGPPAYVAAQVIATAYKAACADGKATRGELLQRIRGVRIANSILGIPVSFDRRGEVPTARFYVSQIQRNGMHKLVW